MKHLSLPIVLLPLLLALLPWPARAAGVAHPSAPHVALDVVDRDSGRILPHYPHRGEAWVPGEPGHRYAVRLRNLGAQRVLAVLSVDGVNAVTGQTADTRQAGYVLEPWQVLEVEGWRKSMDAVAQFVFVDPAHSYASRTGRAENVGVIGIAVFAEKPASAAIARVSGANRATARSESGPPPAAMAAQSARSAEATADAAYAPFPATPGLGTGHGRIESSPAQATTFVRQPRPAQVIQVRYDTRQGLLARGVPMSPPPRHRYDRDTAPQAFPGSFVPDPPCCAQGW